jgi:hypothetical protein
MADLIDSSALRAGCYLVVAVLAVAAAYSDRSVAAQEHSRLWRFSLVLAALVLVGLAAASFGDVGDILTGFGRERAHRAGWYDTRRGVQATVVLGVFAVWCISVIVSILAVPSRRRSYLPAVLGLFTVWAFVAVRLVSYHDIDTLLYSRDIGGVRIVAAVEICLLAATAAAFVFGLGRSRDRGN